MDTSAAMALKIIIFFSKILFISASIVKAKSFISDFAFFIWNQKIGSSLLLKEENYRIGCIYYYLIYISCVPYALNVDDELD